MFRSLWVGMAILILASACAPATQAAPVPVIEDATPSPIPTATPTVFSTETPTASVTPLPTIPTFTPTFDVSTIVTVTPASKAECPNYNSNITASISAPKDDPYDYKEFINSILDFLNSGGSFEILKSMLSKKNQRGVVYGTVIQQSLTNGGRSSIILKSHGSVFIFHCREHKYEVVYSDFPELGALFSTVEITILDDLNKNSIPEILVSKNTCGDTLCNEVKVFEWGGSNFKSLLKRVVDRNGGTTDNTFADEITISDFDENGFQDFIGTSNIPGNPDTFLDCIPCRTMNNVYSWDGGYFVESKLYYSSPTYRFQAVQDADRESQYGNFDKSLSLYQDVIFNNQLQPWSPEIALNMSENFLAARGGEPSPTPVVPDPSEYPRLAAYAYYRIMLLRLAQGHDTDATTVYNTLQEKFGSNPYGSPYVQMATAFWDAYQSTRKMYDGCAAAIQYAAEHPDILIPLGSDYHGWQSHTYVPADVCPFR